MTLESEILGRAPVLYWPLSESTGPLAVDHSGNSHHGAYGGSFSLLQYGPEVGTNAAQLGTSGHISLSPTPIPVLGSQTWFAMMSFPAPGGSNAVWLNNGNGATRGFASQITGSNGRIDWGRYNTIGFQSNSNGFPRQWAKWWQAICMVYNSATNSASLYLDGTLVMSGSPSGTNGGAGGETVDVWAPYGAVIAHVAAWTSVLTAGDVAAISGFVPGWPYGPMPWYVPPTPATGSAPLSLTDPVVIDITTNLDDVLAAVRRPVP